MRRPFLDFLIIAVVSGQCDRLIIIFLVGGTLGCYCRHTYPHAASSPPDAPLFPSVLKGSDLYLYAVFSALGLKVDIRLILDDAESDEDEYGYESDDDMKDNKGDNGKPSYVRFDRRGNGALRSNWVADDDVRQRGICEKFGQSIMVNWLNKPNDCTKDVGYYYPSVRHLPFLCVRLSLGFPFFVCPYLQIHDSTVTNPLWALNTRMPLCWSRSTSQAAVTNKNMHGSAPGLNPQCRGRKSLCVSLALDSLKSSVTALRSNLVVTHLRQMIRRSHIPLGSPVVLMSYISDASRIALAIDKGSIFFARESKRARVRCF